MNALKAKLTINCNTCCQPINRVKTIKVQAETKEDAKVEAQEKIENWKESLRGQNCKVCQSIINEVAV